MTNKKLKLAAMSVALTACVAAQPLVAHAVDAPADPEGKDADPKAALEEGADLKGQEENAPEGKDQVEAPVNKEAPKEDQEPAFAPDTESKDVEIDYKDPQPDPKDPDTTITEGDVIDTSKKDEETGETGKIGEATKTETVDPDASTTEVEMGKTTTHPDGSTTTPGTQITTDQGTGEAKAETKTETQETGDKQKDEKKGQIDLDQELGEDRSKLTWDGVDAEAGKDQEEKAKYNGYTIQESKPSADGNSKELTLKKTEPGEEKHLSAEDIAKLMDESEHLDKKEDGSYTLKKTEDILDEEGKVIGTRTTVYEVTRDSVQTTTETTLKIRMDKGTKKGSEKLDTPIQQPDINNEETKEVLLPSGELENILQDPTTVKKDDGTYTYTETIQNEDGTTTIREYTITKTDEARDLTYQELAERLGEGFTGDENGVYYKGEKLTFEQTEAKRHTLSYQVQIKETHKAFDQVSGKDEAETTAKTEAIKDALRNAAKEYDITLTEDDLKDIKLTGGDLVVTRDGKTYTFHYTEAGVKYSGPTATGDTTVDGKDAEDVKETTVTGTAYVTKGTISWSKDGQTGTYTASGIIKDGEHAAEKPEIPEGAVESTNANGDTVYTVTTHNPDGSTTETIYTFKTEKDVTLTDKQKEDAAWEALAKAEHKSVEELQKEGYKIDSSTFTDITKTSWTVETKTSTTETTKETLNQTLVDDTWTLTGTTLKTKDGQIYKNLKKNPDGTYTATKEDGDKTITYTFTLGEEKDLDEPTIKAMLAAKFPESNGQITLDTTAKTATYKVGETTVTIDYRSLSKKTLKIDKSVSEAVSVTDTIKTDQDLKDAQERLYQELKKKVDAITLQPGEELWIGDLQIKDIDSQKEEIIKHFTTAVSHENMSQQALIAALNAQADEAKTTKVTVNEGTKYQEELKNYYSGDENLKHNPKDPPTHWNGKPKKLEQRDDITHLDLASGAKMNKLPDQNGNVTTTDCVLLAKGQKLEWNYDANNLVKGQGNTEVGLEKHISKDTEDGEGYHYEYDRLDGKNKNPNKSAFYKLTGTVAYDAVKDKKTGKVKTYYDYGSALEAYLEATGKTRRDFSDDEWAAIYGTYVVPITSPGTFVDYTTYQVYTKTAEMTSYGYMTRDANTCVNSTFGRQYDSWDNPEHYKNWDYIGGYDLMISDLVQVSEGKVVGQTQSSIKTLWAPLAIRSTQSLENKSLQLDAKHTSTPKTETENLGSGYEEKGTFTYNVSYKHTDNYNNHCSQGVQGTGTGKYKTFTQLLKEKFSGKGETSYDTGKVSYTYRTTENVDTTALTKDTKNTTTAKATYNFTTVARKNFTVTTPADPEEPTPPQEEEVETPDEVVTPETPELPPVQDATPDDAAPETPVLPSDAVLPAVQDALPQTGVNWMAALGMAFSGMLLTIAGAFASLKYKEKH